MGLKEYKYGKVKCYRCFTKSKMIKILENVKPYLRTKEWQIKVECALSYLKDKNWEAVYLLQQMNKKGRESIHAKNFILRKLKEDICQKELKF